MPQNLEITENAILIRINQRFKENMTDEYLYESTRGIWVLGERKNNAEYAFSIANGVILEVYKINSWHRGGTTPYKTRDDVNLQSRWEFLGELADNNIRNKYVDKDISHYFRQGNANPIKYANI